MRRRRRRLLPLDASRRRTVARRIIPAHLSMRRTVARRIISAHLPMRRIVARRRIGPAHLPALLRLAPFFAPLVAPQLGRIVASRGVIASRRWVGSAHLSRR
jgi:(2Fe-2S) ferredoxin